MEMLKYYVKEIIAFFLHIFWIFPIQKKKIVFLNDHSYSFSDNLKYLALYLLEYDSQNYSMYFSLKNDEGLAGLSIVPVRWLSFKHFFHAITANVLITNNGGISYLPIRKKQLVINTWHGGGPYKVTGTKALNDYYKMSELEEIDHNKKVLAQKRNKRLIYWYEKGLQYNANKFDYMLSSCKMCTDVEAKGLFYTDHQCLDSGMPRLDWMFRKDKVSETRKKVFVSYGIEPNKKLILYAPTFRGFFSDYTGVISDEMLEIDYKQVIEASKYKFGGDWIFAVRLHPRLKDIKIENGNLINMTAYPDAQELLMSLDMLITDYSSVMWDVSFSKNPVFLFAPDINDYQVKRGFYLQINKWPFPLATTNKELTENIINFDSSEYKIKVTKHHDDVGSFEKGNSCQMLKKIIDNHIAIS